MIFARKLITFARAKAFARNFHWWIVHTVVVVQSACRRVCAIVVAAHKRLFTAWAWFAFPRKLWNCIFIRKWNKTQVYILIRKCNTQCCRWQSSVCWHRTFWCNLEFVVNLLGAWTAIQVIGQINFIRKLWAADVLCTSIANFGYFLSWHGYDFVTVQETKNGISMFELDSCLFVIVREEVWAFFLKIQTDFYGASSLKHTMR